MAGQDKQSDSKRQDGRQTQRTARFAREAVEHLDQELDAEEEELSRRNWRKTLLVASLLVIALCGLVLYLFQPA